MATENETNQLKKITQAELDELLKNHERWLDSLDPANEAPRFFNSEEQGQRADLSGLDLSGLDLKRANLAKADLSGANLEGAVLAYANLSEANLTGANLNNVDLGSANLRETHLENASIENANLKNANLFKTDLTGANMKGADLRKVNLEEVNLNGADLKEANLEGANFYDVKMNSANLESANLSSTWLSNIDLINANLDYVYFREASLNYVNLDGASLKNANLTSIETDIVSMTNANLEEAALDNAYLTKTLNLATCNLKNASLKMANLSWTDLRGIELTNVCLEGANLENANLKEAKILQTDLCGANLRFANLEKAYLETTNLDRAALRGAKLENAKLHDVNLSNTNLSSANLKKASLENTNLEGAVLIGVNLSQAVIPEKYKRIAKLSEMAAGAEKNTERQSTAKDYKFEAAKLINKAQRWLGLESDVKIAKTLLEKGHKEKQIQNVIVSFSPETAGKSLVEAFKYSYQVIQKTMTLVSEVSNNIADAMKNRDAAKDYKNEVAKIIAQEKSWPGHEADAKIAQSLLLQGHKKEYIQNAIAKSSPETADKSPTEAFRYSLEIANKVSTIQNVPVENISKIFDEKIQENTSKIDQEKSAGNDIKNLAIETQELKNLKMMMNKVNNHEYPIKIAGIATPENVMAQRKEIGKQISAIRSKEKENVQELDKDKGR